MYILSYTIFILKYISFYRDSDIVFGKQDKILRKKVQNCSPEICSQSSVSFLTILGEEHGVSHDTAVSVKVDEEQVCTYK